MPREDRQKPDMGLDEGRKRAARTTPNPSASISQPMMFSVSRQRCSPALSIVARPPCPGPQNDRCRPVCEKRGRDHVGRGELVRPNREGGTVPRLRTERLLRRSPPARRAASASPVTPAAQPSPNTGTRATSCRNPSRSMRCASRLGVAMPGRRYRDHDVDIRSSEPDPGQRLLRRFHEKVACALKIDLGSVWPAMGFEIPRQRPRRAASDHARGLEHLFDLVEIREPLGQDLPRRCGHIPLLQNMGRNRGCQREHGGGREHRASSRGEVIETDDTTTQPSTDLYQNAPVPASAPGRWDHPDSCKVRASRAAKCGLYEVTRRRAGRTRHVGRP